MRTVSTPRMSPDDLRQNMLATYFSIRVGLVALSSAYPVVFLVYALWTSGTLTQHSISAFYGAQGPAWVRNYFVGTLCGIGALLVMYKGFRPLENWLLNAAGGAAILIAFVPCRCWDGLTPSNKWHNGFAIAFFGCMVAVCELCAFETITLLPTARLQNRFRHAYHTIGVLLFLSPLLAFVVAQSARLPQSLTFFAEWIGVWIFAAYWAVKTAEFRITAAERRALKGELREAPGFGLVPADVPDHQITPKSDYEKRLLQQARDEDAGT